MNLENIHLWRQSYEGKDGVYLKIGGNSHMKQLWDKAGSHGDFNYQKVEKARKKGVYDLGVEDGRERGRTLGLCGDSNYGTSYRYGYEYLS